MLGTRTPHRDDDPARSEKDKMLAGELYLVEGALVDDLVATRAWMVRYNASLGATSAERRAILRERLGAVGDGAAIRPPFFCDYGTNITLGPGVFMNYNCVVLDVCAVTIGARAQIGSAVQIVGGDHPLDRASRERGLEFGRPIAIGADVWIGSSAVILPGVEIGDGAIVGAGAIVTRDVAAGVTVVGNPARPLPRATS